MVNSYKPENYPSVAVYIVSSDAKAQVGFLEDVFDATVTRRFDNPDGSITHAEVMIDDTIVMIGDASNEWPPVTNWLHVYCKDVDTIYDRAIEAGGKELQKPETKPGDPDRRGGFTDPWGNTWYVATQCET